MLTLDNCRIRQQRLLKHMERERLDCAVLSNPKTVYYFSGAWTDYLNPQVFVLSASGTGVLITNQEPKQAAADVKTYTGYTIERPFNRTTMVQEAETLLREAVSGKAVAAEVDSVPAVLCTSTAVNITPAIDEMRRIKDPDEIESIRDSVRLAEAAYAAARKGIEPGMTEFEVYSVVHNAMVRHAETSVDLRGDFACGTRAIRGGGPPTARRVEKGDLYILDLFPVYNGYHCDLTRTFAVGPPSDMQRQAWEVVSGAHDLAAKIIRPGVTGRELYEQVRAHLERFTPACGSFWHHLGHGFGMNGWEFPWLTPGSDHKIQEGEVLAVEPAVYGECLQGGIRLEHDYLVRKDGITALDEFPLDL